MGSMPKLTEGLAISLFSAVSVAILVEGFGAYLDLTYHSLYLVDSFFQPAHAILYNGIFASAGLGIMISTKVQYKLIVILAGIQILGGLGDYLWHTAYGFDGLLSPMHLILVVPSVAISFSAFHHLKKLQSKNSMTLALASFWLSSTFLILMFGLAEQARTPNVIDLPPVTSLIAGLIIMPVLAVQIAEKAAENDIRPIRIVILSAPIITLASLVLNPYLLWLAPVQLIGSILPFLLFEKFWRKMRALSRFIVASSWILIYLPFSAFILTYGLHGKIIGVEQVSTAIVEDLQYYPILAAVGGAVGITHGFLFSAVFSKLIGTLGYILESWKKTLDEGR